MDKRIIIVFLLVIIAIISALLVNKFKPEEDIPFEEPVNIPLISPQEPPKEEKKVEVTEDMLNNIKTDSYLDILVQIKNFDNLNVNYEPLLEAAMRIASAQNLLQEPEEGVYMEYVPKQTIHDIIFELTGIRITEPIVIDDFYYTYSPENDYYVVVPIGSNWLKLDEVKSISYVKEGDQYLVKCSASGGDPEGYGEVEEYPNMEIRLKYKSSNKYIKYQLVSVSLGKEQ